MSDSKGVNVATLLAVGNNKAASLPMPSLYELCVEMPLYRTFEPSGNLLFALRGQDFQFDAYCTECERDSVFRTRREQVWGQLVSWMKQPARIAIETYCGRAGHVYAAYFNFDGTSMTKIGQFPAIADITGADLRKYRPLLKGGYYEELTKSVGLISHGVGVGSFVYLRRIFERLITTHLADLEQEQGKALEGFQSLRMDEKIAVLKDVLPPALVKNRATYAILSKGIHELSEDECKLYFPVVKAAILQILEQDFEARERKLKADQLEAEISRINSALKKGSNGGA